MYPTLFQIGFIKFNTYYVLWAAALLTFLLLTRRRAVALFDMDMNDVTSVMLWIYSFGIVGAAVGGVMNKIALHNYEQIFSGGMSSAQGMLFGGLAGIYMLRRTGLSIGKFSEAAAIPAAAMFAIGRLGCFFNGCCYGKVSGSHGCLLCHACYPFDSIGVYRYPVQLYESFSMFSLFFILLLTERIVGREGVKSGRGTFIFPVYIIFYGALRIYFDTLRDDVMSSTIYWVVAVIFGCAWLVYGCYRGIYGNAGRWRI